MASAPPTLVHGDAKLENLGDDGEVFAAYDEQAGRRLDPTPLDLASIGSLAQRASSLRADAEQETSQHANEPRQCSAGGFTRVRQA